MEKEKEEEKEEEEEEEEEEGRKEGRKKTMTRGEEKILMRSKGRAVYSQ